MAQNLDLKCSITVAILIGAIGYKLFYRQDKYPPVDIDPSNVVYFLPREKLYVNFMESISTITFYEGNLEEAIKYLRKRVADIIYANPWLGGRLVTLNGEVVLHFDKKNHPECFKITDAVDSIEVKSLEDYWEWSKHPTFAEGKLKFSKHLVDKPDAPIFQVSLTPIKGGKFAVVTSMSHTVGDGYTFYMVNNMLSQNATIFHLESKRVSSYSASAKKLIGEEEYSLTDLSFPKMLGIIRNRLRKRNIYFMEIDLDNMKKAKQDATKGVPFVSSNDIITSAFFKAADLSLSNIVVNFRGRIPGIHDKLAGNYFNVISYCKADYQTPALIRKSYQKMKRASSPLTKLPNWVELAKGRFGFISNWSTFYKDVKIPNAEQIMHNPLPRLIPRKSYGEIAIVFRPKEGRLAIASSLNFKAQLGDLMLQ